MNEKLYINDERFGSESYIGTMDEWREGMMPSLKTWYDEAMVTVRQDGGEECTLDEWIDATLEECLSEADEDEIASYPRLTD